MNMFSSLKSEKQERILNSALKEFAKNGYKNAMTDQIAKEANISKGSLFQYFNNKKELFLFLYDHALDIIMNEFFQKINSDEKDILERMRQILSIEFTLLGRYPDVFDFIETVNREVSIDVVYDLKDRNNEYIARSYASLLENIDTTLFKADMEINAAIDVIIWTMEGFGNRQKEKAKHHSLKELDMDEIIDEADVYLNLLRNCFYR